jgi:hypothetical protein
MEVRPARLQRRRHGPVEGREGAPTALLSPAGLAAPQQQEPLVEDVVAVDAGAGAVRVAPVSKGRTDPQPSKRP